MKQAYVNINFNKTFQTYAVKVDWFASWLRSNSGFISVQPNLFKAIISLCKFFDFTFEMFSASIGIFW